MTLYGADDVSRAGFNMQSAAQDMIRASHTFEECTHRLEMQFGQGYGTNIDRLIDALEALAPKPAESERNTALLTFPEQRLTYHTMNQQHQIDNLAVMIREIYKTSDGPRLLAEMMQEFPYPRKRWNEPPGGGKEGGWGVDATAPEKHY